MHPQRVHPEVQARSRPYADETQTAKSVEWRFEPPLIVAVKGGSMNLSGVIGVAAIAIACLGCQQAAEMVYPHAQIVSTQTKTNLFDPNEVHVTLHNTGAAGKVYIRLKNASRVIEQSVFFAKNERRTVVIQVPNDFKGAFDINVTADALRNKVGK